MDSFSFFKSQLGSVILGHPSGVAQDLRRGQDEIRDFVVGDIRKTFGVRDTCTPGNFSGRKSTSSFESEKRISDF